MAAIPYPNNVPQTYADNKMRPMLQWWSGAEGTALRRLVPMVFPHVPVESHIGFATNSGPFYWSGDTATAAGHAPFHEIGGYGSSGGPWNVPAPSSDTSAENEWFATHASPDVVRMLGRPATMTPFRVSGNHVEIPLDDQIAIGVVSIKSHAASANRGLPAAIRFQNPDSLWATALGFMGWSAGSGRAAHHIAPYAPRLAAVPEEQRWDKWLELLAHDAQSGAAPSGGTHNQAVYSAIRTQQKLIAGRNLAQRVNGNVAYFGAHNLSVEDAIARAAGGGGTGGAITATVYGVIVGPGVGFFEAHTVAVSVAAVAVSLLVVYVAVSYLRDSDIQDENKP